MSRSPSLDSDSTSRSHSTGVVLGVTGTLHDLKRSSLVSSLLGGLFSFSKKNASCTRTGERIPPCYLAILLLTSRKTQAALGWKDRSTGQTLLKGKKEIGQARNQTLRKMWREGEKNNRLLLLRSLLLQHKDSPRSAGAASSVSKMWLESSHLRLMPALHYLSFRLIQ